MPVVQLSGPSACKFSKAASYRAIHDYDPVGYNSRKILPGEVTVYRLVGADGTVHERRDVVNGGKIVLTIIANGSKYYDIMNLPTGTFIIKNEAKTLSGNEALIWGMAYTELPKIYASKISFKYSIADDKYKDMPCYKITAAMPAPDEHILSELGIDISKKNVNQKERAIAAWKEKYSCLREILVAKDSERPFIYKITDYNEKGRIVHVENFGVPDYSAKLDMSLFAPPAGHVEVVKEDRDFEKLSQKVQDKSKKTMTK